MSEVDAEKDSWKCARCGCVSSATEAICSDCAFAAPRMYLTSEVSGVSTSVALPRTSFGRRLLVDLDPDGARYADGESQFVVERTDESWTVRNGHATKHATHLDGKPLSSDGVKLESGGRLTVWTDRLALRVTFGI